MGVSDYVHVLRRRWRIVVVTALVGALLGGAYTMTQEEQYTSTSQLFVAIADQSGSDPLQAGQAAQQRLVSYASLATGQAVTQGVIDQLDLDSTTGDVASRITVQYPPGTVLLNISTTGDTAAQARELNGAVDDQLQAVVRRLESVPGGGTPGASLSVVDPPSEGTAAGRSPVLMVVIGLLAGLVVGAILAFVRDRTKRTVDTSDELARALDAPVVGPLDHTQPGDTDIRVLRTKVLSAISGEAASRTVLLTGLAVDTTGIVTALATALGNAGQRVIVVDARSGSAADGGNRKPGLGDILRGRTAVRECVVDLGPGVSLLPAGDLSGTTVNLLASAAFTTILDELANAVDVVVVHAGDLADSPEVVTMAARPVVAIVAIPLGTVHRSAIVAATSDLISAAATTIGVGVGATRNATTAAFGARFSRSPKAGKPPAAGQYPIVAAPYPERPADPGSADVGEQSTQADDHPERQGHRR